MKKLFVLGVIIISLATTSLFTSDRQSLHREVERSAQTADPRKALMLIEESLATGKLRLYDSISALQVLLRRANASHITDVSQRCDELLETAYYRQGLDVVVSFLSRP